MDDSDRIFLEIYIDACTLVLINCLCHVLRYNITFKRQVLLTNCDSESVLQFDWPIPTHCIVLTDRVHITLVGIRIVRVTRCQSSEISSILGPFRA